MWRTMGIGAREFFSYAPTYRVYGDPERIRTSGLQIRNLPLYPAELRGRIGISIA